MTPQVQGTRGTANDRQDAHLVPYPRNLHLRPRGGCMFGIQLCGVSSAADFRVYVKRISLLESIGWKGFKVGPVCQGIACVTIVSPVICRVLLFSSLDILSSSNKNSIQKWTRPLLKMVGKDHKDKQGQHSRLRRLRRSRIFESDSDNGQGDSPIAQPPETFAAPPEAAGHHNSIPARYSTEDDLIQTGFPPAIPDCLPTLGKQQQILEQ